MFANLYPSDLKVALPGMLAGKARSAFSGVSRDRLYQATVTIDSVVNSTAYSLTIQGVTVSYMSDASATDVEIRDGLIAAIAASPYLQDDFAGNAVTATTFTINALSHLADVTSSVGANLSQVVNFKSGVTLHPGTLIRRRGGEFSADGKSLILDTPLPGTGVQGAVLHAQCAYVRQISPFRYLDDADGSGDTTGWVPGQMVPCLKEGLVWLHAETSFAPGDSLFYRTLASATGTMIGAVRNVDDGGNTDQLTSGFSIRQYDAATNLVLVSLNLD